MTERHEPLLQDKGRWPLDIAARPTPDIIRHVVADGDGPDNLNGWWKAVVLALLDDNDDLRTALMDIAILERPTHEHYEDPSDCPHCRSYLLLGLETREEWGNLD